MIDSAVHHALVNQSSVLVNTLTNMVKKVVDGTIADEKAKGPIYLPNNTFPAYRTVKTEIPDRQAVAPVSSLVASDQVQNQQQPMQGGSSQQLSEEQFQLLTRSTHWWRNHFWSVG
jgi:hypothetical protein